MEMNRKPKLPEKLSSLALLEYLNPKINYHHLNHIMNDNATRKKRPSLVILEYLFLFLSLITGIFLVINWFVFDKWNLLSLIYSILEEWDWTTIDMMLHQVYHWTSFKSLKYMYIINIAMIFKVTNMVNHYSNCN